MPRIPAGYPDRVNGGVTMGSNYWSRMRTAGASRRGVLRGAGLAGLGATAWAAVGCGDDNSTPRPATTAAGASASASGSPAAAQPRRGGVINILNFGEPPHLDIHKTSTLYLEASGPGAAYSGLVKPQSTGHKGALIPVGDLAKSWQQPAATTY